MGRRANKAQGKGGGKRMRKRLHNAKKMKNLDKKMAKYYGKLGRGEIMETDADKPQMSRGRPTKMTGKKMRKIRKINQRTQQDRSQMEVEIQATTKKDKKDKVETTKETKKEETPEDPNGNDGDWEDVEMDDD